MRRRGRFRASAFTRCGEGQRGLFSIVTRPTRFELLWWMTMLPSGVARMWRMMPTPEGTAQLWNFSVFGSNRTSASGRLPDSLYQTMSSTTTSAYGCEVAPLGDGHSLNAPVLGSKRPRYP